MTSLGDFLRTRRERIGPADVGLPAGDRRRVPGLRREEVALLAGISPEYYLRLEQGRDRHPSDQVVDGLARALRLDVDETRYLHDVARPRRSERRPARPETVSPGVQTLIDSWTTTPALVQGRLLTTLAANRLAVALSPHFAPGVNTLRAAFLEPEMREFYRDWDATTAKAVAFLRSVVTDDVHDPHWAELIDELTRRSDRFRTLWARQDVRRTTSGQALLLHPQVGPLDLHYEKLILPGPPDQLLITYHAAPGSPSHERLRRLSLVTAA